MTVARRAAIERDTLGKKALEKHLHEEAQQQDDDLHREIGERLTAGILGVFDLLANLGRRDYAQSQINESVVMEAVRQAIDAELQNIKKEIQDLRGIMEEVRAGINRIDRFTLQSLYHFNADETDEGQETRHAPTDHTPASGRASREVVIDRVFSAAQRLIEEGQDISEMTSTALAHAAGVKPTQFTYAFKTRAGFEAQFARWIDSDSDTAV